MRQLQSKPILEKLHNYLLEIDAGSIAEESGGTGGALHLEELERTHPLLRGWRSRYRQRRHRALDPRRSRWSKQLGIFGSDQGGKTAAVLRANDPNVNWYFE
jgi:hypothetical protein